MSLTIELPPEIEKQVEERAAQNGQSAEEFAAALLSRNVAAPQIEKPRRVLRGRGLFAGSGRTVDDFLAERRAEAEMEMEQAEERDRMRREREKECDAGS